MFRQKEPLISPSSEIKSKSVREINLRNNKLLKSRDPSPSNDVSLKKTFWLTWHKLFQDDHLAREHSDIEKWHEGTVDRTERGFRGREKWEEESREGGEVFYCEHVVIQQLLMHIFQVAALKKKLKDWSCQWLYSQNFNWSINHLLGCSGTCKNYNK